MPSLLGKCNKACDNVNAGNLLYRIGYWDRRNERNGQLERWSKKSREDWAEELGLSIRMVGRALALLKSLNLIDSKRGFFNGLNVYWVRLSSRAQGIFKDVKTSDFGDEAVASYGPSVATKYGTVEPAKSGHSHVSDNYSDNYSEKDTGTGPEESTEISFAKDGEITTLKSVKEDIPVKASEVLEKYHAGKKNRTGKNASELAYAFKELYAQATGKFALNLTAAQMGMLSNFRKAVPDDAALAVLTRCVGNWTEFISEVKKVKGLQTVPFDPKVEFLYKYRDVAINFTPATAEPVIPAKSAQPQKFVVNKAKHDIANPMED